MAKEVDNNSQDKLNLIDILKKHPKVVASLGTLTVLVAIWAYNSTSNKNKAEEDNINRTDIVNETNIKTPDKQDDPQVVFYIDKSKKYETNNKYGKAIIINNYDQYLKDMPSDKRDALNNGLYNMVDLNVEAKPIPLILDAEIVAGSVKLSYDEEDEVYYGKFDVSIKSINRLFEIHFSWSDNNTAVNPTEYTNSIKCTGSNDECIDDYKHNPNNPEYNKDPIVKLLPYDTLHYVVTLSSKNTLVTSINLSLSDTRDGMTEKSVKKYKKEVEDWFKTTGLNRNDYKFIYYVNL